MNLVGSAANPAYGRESRRRTVIPSCGEQVKLLRERQLLPADRLRLLFMQHMSQPDASPDRAGTDSVWRYGPHLGPS